MREIKMYESFDGLRFEKKEDCEKYETEHIPEIEVEGVKCYDENLNPLKTSLNNWDKIKFLKLESHRADTNFYKEFCKVLDSVGKEPDIKLDNYSDIDVWEETLLIWDEYNKEWSHFKDILCGFENISRTFETYKTLVEKCRKIIN